MKRLALGFTLGVAASTAIVTFAQSGKPDDKLVKASDTVARILLGELQIQAQALSGKEAPAAERVDMGVEYAKLGSDLEAQRLHMGGAVTEFYRYKSAAQSAVQVSQAADEAQVRLRALEVSQNRRIIELLEQLANRK